MARPVFRRRWRSASTKRSAVARKRGCGCKWPTTWRRPASTKARLRSSGLCDGSWKSRAREAEPGVQFLMLTSTAIVAGDRWPVGCALLVVVLLSLLLWALLWILLWQLFSTPSGADFQENIRRRLKIRSCFPAIRSGCRGIAAAGFNGLHLTGNTGLIGLAHSRTPHLDELPKFSGNL